MDEVAKLIQESLPHLPSELLEKTKEKLIKIGVCEFDDMKLIQEDDLSDVLRPIDIRKLILACTTGPGSDLPVGKYHIWSLMSTSNDQYIKVPLPPDVAKADGSSDDPSSITMNFKKGEEEKDGMDDMCYSISIEINRKTYYLTNDGTNILFKQGTGSTENEIWLPEHMFTPNDPFYVIRSYKIPFYYLSSDGAGNLKLKPFNSSNPKHRPPFMNPYIDAALLFRLIESKS